MCISCFYMKPWHTDWPSAGHGCCVSVRRRDDAVIDSRLNDALTARWFCDLLSLNSSPSLTVVCSSLRVNPPSSPHFIWHLVLSSLFSGVVVGWLMLLWMCASCCHVVVSVCVELTGSWVSQSVSQWERESDTCDAAAAADVGCSGQLALAVNWWLGRLPNAAVVVQCWLQTVVDGLWSLYHWTGWLAVSLWWMNLSHFTSLHCRHFMLLIQSANTFHCSTVVSDMQSWL